MHVRIYLCVSVSMCLYVCVAVSERERERKLVYVCVYTGERARQKQWSLFLLAQLSHVWHQFQIGIETQYFALINENYHFPLGKDLETSPVFLHDCAL